MDIYQLMPSLTDDEFKELKADIEKRGVLVPVEFDEDGHILDGHHRYRACQELGITNFPKITRVGFSKEEKHEHIRRLNLARRHLTITQRKSLILEQLQDRFSC